jgi:hypothetical protein
MKAGWIPAQRRRAWPWWTILLPLLWMALGGADLLLGAAAGRPVPLCLLQCLTGWPCPTCGFTRGMLAILQGHPFQGWLYNPLLFSALGLWAVALAGRVLLGRSLHVHLTRRERIGAGSIAGVLFVVNWLYVIRCVG